MKLKLSELASVAEIVASIAVILSLIFVGLQLSEGNRVTRATTNQLAVQSEIDMATAFLDHAGIWNKMISGVPIDDREETRKAIILLNIFMLDTESRYQQFHSGYLEPASWEGRRAILPEVVEYPIYDRWRKSPGGRNHSAQFLELLDSLSSAN